MYVLVAVFLLLALVAMGFAIRLIRRDPLVSKACRLAGLASTLAALVIIIVDLFVHMK